MTLTPLGSDRSEPAPDGTIALRCAVPKGWFARRAATRTSAEYPGTAVSWEGNIFEVVEIEFDPAGGACYRIAPWDERHTIRILENYDESAEARREAERRRRRESLAKRRASILLAPLLGHLPGPVQRRMESEFGAPARGMTIVSALPLLALGVIGIMAFLALSFGATAASFAGWPILPLPLAIYLFAESALRAGVAFLEGAPMGSAAGTLLDALWRAGRALRSRRQYASPAAPGPQESGKGDP